MHEFRTNRTETDSDRTSNGRLCPFCPVESFEHVQNFPPDRTDINGHHRTRNGFTGLEMDIKRIRTDTNGLKDFLSVTHPLARCDRNFIYIYIDTVFFSFHSIPASKDLSFINIPAGYLSIILLTLRKHAQELRIDV